MQFQSCAVAALVLVCTAELSFGDQATPAKGFYSFLLVLIRRSPMSVSWKWAPLKLEGLPEGIEIATLRGDLAKGGGEILLRTPPTDVVPNHSHTNDELYLWLKGSFIYIAADGTRQQMSAPAYISLPGEHLHGLGRW